MHRIGGIEKEDVTGNISYEPKNHQLMVDIRSARIQMIGEQIPEAEVEGDADADVLVIGWGSTWGAINGACGRLRRGGRKIAWVNLHHLHPFPANLGDVLARYETILVPEMNLGQLSRLIRSDFLVDARSITKVAGQPFTAGELVEHFLEAFDD